MSCLRNKGLSALAFEKTQEQSKLLTRPSPSYTINESGIKNLIPQCHSVSFLHDQYQKLLSNQYHWIEETCYVWDKTTEKSIIILYLKNKAPSINKFTILFSHNVCSDLGNNYAFLYDLSTQLKCDVIAYDYIALIDIRSYCTVYESNILSLSYNSFVYTFINID